MWLIFAIVFVLGLALTIAGRRGRRTDDHPLCRRCRFDLTGRPDTAERRCPECGADLGRPRAVVVGHRRRRAGVLACGLLVLVPTLGVGGWLGYTRAKHFAWIEHAPLRYVLWQATSADNSRQSAAIAEVDRRLELPSLSDQEWGEIVDFGTARLTDPAISWSDGWAGVFFNLRVAGRELPADRRRRLIDGLCRRAELPDNRRGNAALLIATFVTLHSNGDLLDPTDRERIITATLDYQGRSTNPPDRNWMSILETRDMADLLSPSQAERQARQCWSASLEVRPRVRQGDPLPYFVHIDLPRAGPWHDVTDCPFATSWTNVRWWPPTNTSDTSADQRTSDWTRISKAFPASASATWEMPYVIGTASVPDTFRPGMQTARVAFDLVVYNKNRGALYPQGRVTLGAPFELLPADHPSTRLASSPAARDAIRACVKDVRVWVGLHTGMFPPPAHAGAAVSLRVTSPPVNLAMAVLLRDGNRTTYVGGFGHAVGADETFEDVRNDGVDAASPDAKTVDVILRSDAAAGASAINILDAWAGEVVIPNVPVERR